MKLNEDTIEILHEKHIEDCIKAYYDSDNNSYNELTEEQIKNIPF